MAEAIWERAWSKGIPFSMYECTGEEKISTNENRGSETREFVYVPK